MDQFERDMLLIKADAMTAVKDFGFGTQIRKSPYFDATVKWGAKDFFRL